MIDVQPQIDKLEELKLIMNWLIDGYFQNGILKFLNGKMITKEFIIRHYNVDPEYFNVKKE